MELKNVALFVYTHSDYQDVWIPCFDRLNKFFPEIKKYIFLNQECSEIPENFIQIIYDDKLIYRQRMTSCLEKVNEEFLVLTHEDFLLYDKVDFDKVEEYQKILSETNLSFVRFIKTGENRDIPYKHPGLFTIPLDSNFIFAIQPTLWKKENLLKVYNDTPGNTIWEFENNAQNYCRQNNINGLYSYYNTPKRGGGHWDSADFPYMATAVVKGKWNISEYGTELERVFEEYNIDKNIRGLF